MVRAPFLAAVLIAGTLLSAARGQVPATIDAINADVTGWTGVFVSTIGYWVSTDDGTFLWTSIGHASETRNVYWTQRLRVTGGGAMPANPETLTYAQVQVDGLISIWVDESPPADPHNAGSIDITSFTVLTPPPPNTTPPPAAPRRQPAFQTMPCDTCHFVLILSGYDDSEYWTDVREKYDYKLNYKNVCEDNIVVLFADSSLNPAVIPKGSSNGSGDFTSGGVFPASQQNVERAFAYLEQRMNELNCDTPSFQFHSTGHGGGYHTNGTQTGYTRASGYGDGIADMSGDEKTKIYEGDLVFCAKTRILRDTDGDGDKDLGLIFVNNPNPPPAQVIQLLFDSDNDGNPEFHGFDDTTGTNSNNYIDSNDPTFIPPDLNQNGMVDSVGFDESIGLGDEEELTDDELADLIAMLQANTNLSKDSTRAELAQCFSGGFHDDLEATVGEVATSCAEGEVSFRSLSRGYNIYQHPFVDALKAGASWEGAHNAAATAVGNEPTFTETPDYEANTNPPTNIPVLSGRALVILATVLLALGAATLRRA